MPHFGGILLGTLAMASLVACGGQDRYAPAGDGQSAGLDTEDARRAHLADATTAPNAAGDATLVVATHTGAPSFLGSVHAVVSDAAGNVVAGADEDEDANGAGSAGGELSLSLPSGEGYSVRLEARTTDPEPADCQAVVGPLAVESGASARLQVLSWQCGERTGYVPPSANSDCYWLVDWLTVARASAGPGDAVPVRVERSAAAAAPGVDWQVTPASAGRFLEPAAAETSFVCDEPGSRPSLSVTVTRGDCVERISQPLTCAR